MASWLSQPDEYGRLLRNINSDKYNYMIRGQKVAAGVTSFLKTHDSESGSSVSTALAAGLCSLILTCDRMACPGNHVKNLQRKEKVRKHLNNMKTSGESKYVILERFGGIDSTVKDGAPEVNAYKILKEEFGVK
jgi:hypothetical protein